MSVYIQYMCVCVVLYCWCVLAIRLAVSMYEILHKTWLSHGEGVCSSVTSMCKECRNGLMLHKLHSSCLHPVLQTSGLSWTDWYQSLLWGILAHLQEMSIRHIRGQGHYTNFTCQFTRHGEYRSVCDNSCVICSFALRTPL